jgi:hypothetical protein
MRHGGRIAGTPNKATQQLRELVEAEAGAPIPVLLARIGRSAYENGHLELATTALAKAATYVYGRPRDAYEEPLPRIVMINDIQPMPPEHNEDGSRNIVIRNPVHDRP